MLFVCCLFGRCDELHFLERRALGPGAPPKSLGFDRAMVLRKLVLNFLDPTPQPGEYGSPGFENGTSGPRECGLHNCGQVVVT